MKGNTVYWIIGFIILVAIVYFLYRKNNPADGGTGLINITTTGNSFQNPNSLVQKTGTAYWVSTKPPAQAKTIPVYGCHNGIRYLKDNNNPAGWVKLNQPCQKTDIIF